MDPISKLRSLTGKKNVVLTSRGNKAIKQALQIAREKYNKLYLADQGGWITYRQYAQKLKFDVEIIKTEDGLIHFNQIEEGAIIFNDMPSYAFLQNIFEKKKNVFYIADITGSIGTRKVDADIVVCSFGNNKMINLGNGGMIASDREIKFDATFQGDAEELDEKIDALSKRLVFLRDKRREILRDLSDFEIIQKDENGINILVDFDDEDEKIKVMNYCKDNGLEYKICPMPIKILRNAISIEVQNLSR